MQQINKHNIAKISLCITYTSPLSRLSHLPNLEGLSTETLPACPSTPCLTASLPPANNSLK